MKLKLLVIFAAGLVAMGLLLGASMTQAQTEHLPALYRILDEDAVAAFPVTAPVTPPDTPGGGGGGGDSCFIDTVGGFFPSIFFMSGDDYRGRVSERSSPRGKRPVGWGRGRIYSSHGDRSQ